MLRDYFRRIGYTGDSRPDIEVLHSVLRHHVCAVPFENLDVQLGRPVTTDVDAAYEKIIVNGRGGWCYEQNGLFGWALSEIGFDVTRVAAAVMRQERGDIAAANHLCLLVREPESDARYLADVGFGGSLLRPIELLEAEHQQVPYRLGLRNLADGSWRFWEDNGDGEFSFDFNARPADEFALSQKCDFLQSDPTSGFVLNLVAQLRSQESHKALRGRVLNIVSATGSDTQTLNSANELVAVLLEHFGLDVPETEELWPEISARHKQIFPA